MLVLDKAAVARALPWPVCVDAIEAMFRADCKVPVRHHHSVDVPGTLGATVLLMPAWTVGGYLGVKVANVFPGNAAIGLPSVSSTYMLYRATTGQPLAVIDGGELTSRRTAASSALAARYLARQDAQRLLIVGTGQVASHLAYAHASVLPIRKVDVWGRTEAKVEAIVQRLRADGFDAAAVTGLEAAVNRADVVSCATLSLEPLISGKWLSSGTHLDLIGGFTPSMREADDDAVRRSSVFVDTREGATLEAGDIVVPLRNGTLTPAMVLGDLSDLVRGVHRGRSGADEITMFKSVGAAMEDLASAIAVYEHHVDPGGKVERGLP
jgi:ornithine cyclodeaminase/alanine dehydrogenase-like protein (mu-crystallin family)